MSPVDPAVAPLPTPLPAPDQAADWVIGIDAGGTKLAGGLVNLATGDVRHRREVPTVPARGAAALADALMLAQALLAAAPCYHATPARIGLGVPELVDRQGRIADDDVIHWRDLPVQAAFDDLLPTTVASDVRAAALAEAHFGAGRPYSLFAYITVGTGIASTIIIDGQALAGVNGNAIALASGHLTLPASTEPAAQRQVLEEYASGPALARRYQAATGIPTGRAEPVFAAAAAGDATAAAIIRSGAASLGNSLGFVANLIDPAAIIIGGGLGLAGGLYWETLVAATRAHTWARATRALAILPAALGCDAGIIGAAISTQPATTLPHGGTPA